jgi:ornithine cyclodeaminase/alanine dehydrogenase-like protein (mu-crystallin family)
MLVLKEEVITNLFAGLDREGVVKYQDTLLAALAEYEQDPSIIPPRIVTTTQFCTHLFMASTGSRVGMKAITGSKEGFKGITTILDKETGYPIGIINGATLTAFRTALCNTLPLVKFYPLDREYGTEEKLVVFGVGDQAIWHIRLTLILYPGRFSQVVIVNRTVSKAENLCARFTEEYPDVRFQAASLPTGDSEDLMLKVFKNASVIFTCIPTSVPTVTTQLIDQCQGRCFIGAIGSYKPHMTEIEGQVLQKHVISEGNKIIVDSIEHCMHEAGELIINRIEQDNLMNISSLYTSNSEWFGKSRIAVSKLVGLCIMDVWVGSHCLNAAREAGIGLDIENF